MLIILIGPKGSGKSYIGRILESSLGVYFLHVEPLWMAYCSECKQLGRQPVIAEGIRRVHPVLKSALRKHKNLCVETTGASSEILDDLLSLGRNAGILLVRVEASLQTCLRRIATRDQTHQIFMDRDLVEEVYRLSTSLQMPFDLFIQNERTAEHEIVQSFSEALAKSD
jgi:shikimate kinase